MCERFKASAPGKLMLFGEHAVLHHKMAIVCAVDKRMSVTLTPRSDRKIHIHSQIGTLQTDLDHLNEQTRFGFLIKTIQYYASVIDQGLDLNIRSDFPQNLGLGSSAAVTAATAAVICSWKGVSKKNNDLFMDCRNIVQQVQGKGSGTDLAASIFGGIIAYRMHPLLIQPLEKRYPITAIYAGYKTATPWVIEQVEKKRDHFPQLYDRLFDAIDDCSRTAITAIQKTQWEKVGRLMNIHQGLLDALGVNDKHLCDIVYALRQTKGILGAKISGSGLGDCVIALGQNKAAQYSYQTIDLEISEQGLYVEKI